MILARICGGYLKEQRMGIKSRTDALGLEEEMARIDLGTTPSHREPHAGEIQPAVL